MMKKGFTALKSGTWEEYKEAFRKKMKASHWAFERIKEAFEVAAQGETEKVSIMQEIMLSTDCLRRIIAPVGGKGGVTMSYLCPNCNIFPLEDYVWWVSGRKTPKWWCAICGGKYDRMQPNRLLVVQIGESFEQAKVVKAHAVPEGLCANLVNALKLEANQQEDGDGFLQNIVKNLGKESRKGLTNGLREFIKVDNERAPWMLERHAGAREHFRFGSRKLRKGARM